MNRLFIALFLLTTTVYANADQRGENALTALQMRSTTLRIDVSSSINSIQEKYAAALKVSKGQTAINSLLKIKKSISDQQEQLLGSTLTLKNDTYMLMDAYRSDSLNAITSRDGELSPWQILSTTLREVNCIEFSLSLLTFQKVM